MAKTEVKRVLLDASALIGWIKGEPPAGRLAGLMDMIESGDAELVESVIILSEVYGQSDHPDPAERERRDSKLKVILTKLQSREVLLLDVTKPVALKVAELRQLQKGLKLADATHLATALLNRCDWLVTLDRDFRPRADLRIINLCKLDPAERLPWDHPIQDGLFDDQPANVIHMRSREAGEL